MSLVKKVASIRKNFLEEKKNGSTQKALLYLYKKTKYYFFLSLWFILTAPIAYILIAIRPIVKIYLVMLQTSRIGHFSASAELMLIRNNNIPQKKREFVLFFEEPIISNKQLSRMYRRVLPILPFPNLCYEIDKTLKFLMGEKYTKYPAKIYSTGFFGVGKDIGGLLEIRDVPYIYFTRKEINQAEVLLERLGIPRGKKFVCLLVRDSNYLKMAVGQGIDFWSYHNIRDSDINNYKKAALYLAEKGYYVIRMGKFVKEPLIIDHPRIIDYANHPLHCDLLDIYLAAYCHFIISTSTGLDCISQLFRRPLLFTDVFPLMDQLQFWYPCVLFIPKKLYDIKINKILSFRELKDRYNEVSMLEIQDRFKKDNIEVILNTEDEIFEAVCEMESRVNHTWVETDEDKSLQKKFLASYPDLMIKEEYKFPVDSIKIKMGATFIRKNLTLL
ncbi:MAG: hypothetical protein ACD_45C00473G0004 [uncultured bacterium]|nr:MAG: hypothetical protein ACD_45C00473G0004 [uncultured bacterium]